ncbi:hypothetical protein L1049_008762 [Liquidambar formosana]|uniref:Uncharacterized protein n=1 Tax=Liquidambar formosana TaxID=63359 RepID=A0AAP0X4T4_LIQFO
MNMVEVCSINAQTGLINFHFYNILIFFFLTLLYTHSSHLLAKTIISPSNLLQTEFEFANPLTRGWLRVKFDELWSGAKNRMKRDFHEDELPLQLQYKDLPDHLDDNQ